MARRFIVVDPSFMSHEEDRWQYAVDLAKSAHDQGFEFVILAHENAPFIQEVLDFNVVQKNIFKYTFYNHEKIYSRHWNSRRLLARRDRNARLHERIRTLEAQRDRAWDKGDSIGAAIAEKRIARTRNLAIIRERIVGWIPGRDRDSVRPFNRDDFAIALARELEELRPSQDDMLFFHTMSYGMMESLAEVTAYLGHPEPFDTSAYFLFHFGAASSDARTFLDRYHSYSAYGSIGDRLRVASPFSRMYFLATSEVLQSEASEILNARVGLWHGLVNEQQFELVLGGPEMIAHGRMAVERALAGGTVRIVARAVDLDAEKSRALARACHLIQHRGYAVELRVIYHAGIMTCLRDVVRALDFPNVSFINTDRNEDYLKEIFQANLVVLAYDQEKYEKRVSAVLHDCAVLGVPTLVPAHTTLADFAFACRFVYGSSEDMLGAALNAIRYLLRRPHAGQDYRAAASRALAGNSVSRLSNTMEEPSINRSGRSPVANVIMPLWGRVGSSVVIEGQIRLLTQRGYFVNQVFVADRPNDRIHSIEYFWRILAENSYYERGAIQRVAFVPTEKADNGRRTKTYLNSGAFDQMLARIARSDCEDDRFMGSLKQAELTIVNHVFNAEFAHAHCGGRKILETHDIQSYQMVHWPLINESTQAAEPLPALLKAELKAVARFDHIVNLAPEEHVVLSIANPRSSLVTPYIKFAAPVARYPSVAVMAQKLGWHGSYFSIDKFDLLIAGDSHSANRESTIWFIREVFEPYLAPLGITLAIVGRLSIAMLEEVGSVPFVFYTGFVDELDSVKALSRLAILPDKRGTGISIKTLETLASGMPFVSTSVALRGICDRLPADCISHDDPESFADAIRRALSMPGKLKAMSALSRRCYDAVAGKEQYEKAWNSVLSDVSGRSVSMASKPASASAEDMSIESKTWMFSDA